MEKTNNKIQQILNGNDLKAKKALFSFDQTDSNEAIAFKFNLWSRYFFPQYFSSKDAPYHKTMDGNNIKAYRGQIRSYTNITFRGGAKSARTKLFIGFALANDLDHFRKYIKVLSSDFTNSAQVVTDLYNILIDPKIIRLYPEIFEKTNKKREERMSSFTTSTGIKVLADTVGTEQRGSIQENARPDLIWFEDIENRKTLRSAVITKAIWDNMEEARTGLSINGSYIVTCNYISELGNVHRLVEKSSDQNIVDIIPIIDEKGVIAWADRYTQEDIEQMKKDDDDFEGERMCRPSASKDVIFDREALEKQKVKEPIKEIAGFKIFYEYNPSHRYASGHDVSGGVGLDSSTSVFIDFDTIPARVVATFANNNVKPDVFADEIKREGEYFGEPLCAIEKNNHGYATIARAKQLGVKLFKTPKTDTRIDQTAQPTEYGWNTNAATKPKMIFALVKACNDGLLELSDYSIIKECMSYTRNDVIDNEPDPRLSTRHFDLLMATAIAWQMKDYAEVKKINYYIPEEEKLLYPEIGC